MHERTGYLLCADVPPRACVEAWGSLYNRVTKEVGPKLIRQPRSHGSGVTAHVRIAALVIGVLRMLVFVVRHQVPCKWRVKGGGRGNEWEGEEATGQGSSE